MKNLMMGFAVAALMLSCNDNSKKHMEAAKEDISTAKNEMGQASVSE